MVSVLVLQFEFQGERERIQVGKQWMGMRFERKENYKVVEDG